MTRKLVQQSQLVGFDSAMSLRRFAPPVPCRRLPIIERANVADKVHFHEPRPLCLAVPEILRILAMSPAAQPYFAPSEEGVARQVPMIELDAAGCASDFVELRIAQPPSFVIPVPVLAGPMVFPAFGQVRGEPTANSGRGAGGPKERAEGQREIPRGDNRSSCRDAAREERGRQLW